MQFPNVDCLHVARVIAAMLILLGSLLMPAAASAQDAAPVAVADAPVRWNTFIGGIAGDEAADKLDVAPDGSLVVSGESDGTWGTPINAYSPADPPAKPHTWLARLNRNGDLVWHTFLDFGISAVRWDGAGNIIAISGSAIIAKLSGEGHLLWVKRLYDGEGNVVLQGLVTRGTDLFVAGGSNIGWGAPIRPFTGPADAFVAKVDGAGSLVWNTFLGSGAGPDPYNNYDDGRDLTLDDAGNIYIAGVSRSTWGAPVRPFSPSSSSITADAFIARLDPDGNLVWNTFLGSDADDYASKIVYSVAGALLAYGGSLKTWGDPLQAPKQGNLPRFVARLDENGVLVWDTFVDITLENDHWIGLNFVADNTGNSFIGIGCTYVQLTPTGLVANPPSVIRDSCILTRDIAVAENGVLLLAGVAQSAFGAPVHPYTGGDDAIMAKVTTTGDLVWHTYLGGSAGEETVSAIARSGSDLVVGGLSNDSFGKPLLPFSWESAVFVAKLDAGGNLLWNTFLPRSDPVEGVGVFMSSLVADASGNVYVSMVSNYKMGHFHSSIVLISKLDPQGGCCGRLLHKSPGPY